MIVLYYVTEGLNRSQRGFCLPTEYRLDFWTGRCIDLVAASYHPSECAWMVPGTIEENDHVETYKLV